MLNEPDNQGEEVFLSLGSNVGDRRQSLLQAVDGLRGLLQEGFHCSRVYETKPVDLLDQPDFLNLVVGGKTTLPPLELLKQLNMLERRLGRRREIRFGPRTIDVDILLYGHHYICFRNLQIPHPRMWERAFVLVPLAELVPSYRGLGGETIAARAKRIAKEGDLQDVGYLR